VETFFDGAGSVPGVFAASIFSSAGDCGVRSAPRMNPGGTVIVSVHIDFSVEASPGISS
jgi:hypothetical protein